MLKKTLIKGIAALSLSAVAATAMANERIISAGSAVTELILALEQQNQLVAVDVTSELPQDLELPKIGYHRRLSSEGLMALNPTRLIGSDEMGPETSLSQLKTAGVEVDIVNTLPTPEGLLERIDEIAALTDSQKNAEALKAEVNQQISSLEKNKAKTKEAKKSCFC